MKRKILVQKSNTRNSLFCKITTCCQKTFYNGQITVGLDNGVVSIDLLDAVCFNCHPRTPIESPLDRYAGIIHILSNWVTFLRQETKYKIFGWKPSTYNINTVFRSNYLTANYVIAGKTSDSIIVNEFRILNKDARIIVSGIESLIRAVNTELINLTKEFDGPSDTDSILLDFKESDNTTVELKFWVEGCNNFASVLGRRSTPLVLHYSSPIGNDAIVLDNETIDDGIVPFEFLETLETECQLMAINDKTNGEKFIRVPKNIKRFAEAREPHESSMSDIIFPIDKYYVILMVIKDILHNWHISIGDKDITRNKVLIVRIIFNKYGDFIVSKKWRDVSTDNIYSRSITTKED